MTEDEIREIVRNEMRKMQKEDYEKYMLKIKLEKEKAEKGIRK